jgi:antitoxin component YwqK of YwqJK toxin-antitoxin module
MARAGTFLAIVCVGLVGCHRGPADCPGGAQLQGKKPPAGQLQWCARPDGVKHGPWREWHANGNTKSAGSYVDGKMEGTWQTFFEDGALKSEGVYRGGFKDGIWTQYYDKGEGGTKNRVEEHHAGSNEVKWTGFRPNGAKWAEGTQVGTRPQGAYTEYYPDGKVAVKGNYNSGEKTGDWSYFDAEGKPSPTKPPGTFQ